MNQDFLHQLELQAQKQALLNEKRFLPKQLDFLTSLIGRYPWQFCLSLSFLVAVVFELV